MVLVSYIAVAAVVGFMVYLAVRKHAESKGGPKVVKDEPKGSKTP